MSTYTCIEDVRGEARIDSRDLIEVRDELHERPLSMFELGDLELMLAIDELEQVGFADWSYGATMIREDSFEDYARELAEDIGAVSSYANWPTYYINWKQAARELAQDYTLVTFLEHDYYVR